MSEFNPNTVFEEARSSNTSYRYSGRHDHGPMPQLNSSGHYAMLCSALLNAKDVCDRVLTEEIGKIVQSDDITQVLNLSDRKKKKKRIESNAMTPTGDVVNVVNEKTDIDQNES